MTSWLVAPQCTYLRACISTRSVSIRTSGITGVPAVAVSARIVSGS